MSVSLNQNGLISQVSGWKLVPFDALAAILPGFFFFQGVGKLGMIGACESRDALPMPTASLASTLHPSSGASSAIPWRASSRCNAAEKNDVCYLRPVPAHLLRPQAPSGPRPLLRRHARL